MTWLSLPLGLAAWILPLCSRKYPTRRLLLVLASFLCCSLSLLNVLLELWLRTSSGDYAALSDITNNLAICSIILVVGLLIILFLTSTAWQKFRSWKTDNPWWQKTVNTIGLIVITGIVLFNTVDRPGIHLREGVYLMLEAEAPMFFAIAFGVVTLVFVLFLQSFYRKRKDRTGLLFFILQWVLTLAAFHFLMKGLTLLPGEAGGMYTETVSGAVGMAGLCWAGSILFLCLGLSDLFAKKEKQT